MPNTSRRQAALARAVLNSASDFAIVTTDMDGCVTSWNPGAEMLLGWSEAEMLGADACRFFTPEDNAAGRCEYEMQVAKDAGRCEDERWHLKKDGSRLWASGLMMRFEDDESGEQLGYLKILRDRTPQHQANERMRESERQYRTLVEQSTDFIGEASLDGEVLLVNPAGLAMVGLADAAAARGTRIIDYFTPASREIVTFIVLPKVEQNGYWEGELDFRHFATDEAIPVLYNIFPLRNAEGEITSYGTVTRDLRERRRAERLRFGLAELSDRLRDMADPADMQSAAAEVIGAALQASRVGYGSVDQNGRTFTVPQDWTLPGFPSLAGTYEIDDYGLYAADLRAGITVTIEDVPNSSLILDSAPLTALSVGSLINHPIVEDGRMVAILYVNDPGPRVWLADEIVFLKEAGDRLRQATERRRAEVALRVLNARLETEVEARTADRNRLWALSADIMLICATDGTIEATNPAWTRALGWSATELVGTNLFDLVHPDDVAHTAEGAGAIREGASLERFENRYRHKDGSYRDISWTAGPGEGVIVAVGRDVTEEKAKAVALEVAAEQLRQSQKMEAVGQLTGGLAHDFNNLLTGISGSLEMMAIRIAQGRMGDVEKHNIAAQGAAKRAAALTHRLLAFSRHQTLDPKPTRPNYLIEGMMDLIERTVGPAIEARFDPEEDVWTTLVDPHQLENALLNLCINARDAMPDGGKLTIETRNRIIKDRVARAYDLEPGSYVSLCVADTGTGMTPDVIAKAFDPFFTTKPLGVGTGLGLSMIYGFAKQSSGQVRIHSSPGAGTNVCIYLPRHAEEAFADGEDREADLEDAPRAEDGETVLVVDDEPSVRMLVTDVLEELGYTAIEAADGAGGLQVLRSDARIDLLVSDVGLPGGMNGRQMADAARGVRPDLKVLFITGYAENSAVGNGSLPKGMYVMTKPFAMEALATRIRSLIEEG